LMVKHVCIDCKKERETKSWNKSLRCLKCSNKNNERIEKIKFFMRTQKGKLGHNWKGGIDRKEQIRKWIKENPEKVRRIQQRRLAVKKGGGPLFLKEIQFIYEENIKKFGTLTCVYCLKKLSFGEDSLEHIIPLSRGGTNKRDNLSIACLSCNCSKADKLLNEWRSV